MRAMILLAHGSRREESAKEVKEMAKELEKQALKKGQFDIVKPAFMQFCGPDFYQVVDEVILNIEDNNSVEGSGEVEQKNIKPTNKKEIIILPYFISAGSHVAEDIPELINKASAKYPDISFKVTPHLGKFQGLPKLILQET